MLARSAAVTTAAASVDDIREDRRARRRGRAKENAIAVAIATVAIATMG